MFPVPGAAADTGDADDFDAIDDDVNNAADDADATRHDNIATAEDAVDNADDAADDATDDGDATSDAGDDGDGDGSVLAELRRQAARNPVAAALLAEMEAAAQQVRTDGVPSAGVIRGVPFYACCRVRRSFGVDGVYDLTPPILLTPTMSLVSVTPSRPMTPVFGRHAQRYMGLSHENMQTGFVVIATRKLISVLSFHNDRLQRCRPHLQ